MPVRHVINKGKPVLVWTNDIDSNATEQLENMSRLPFIHKHVAAMPDVHWGMGATIGSVIPTKGAIIPAAVGVDIGCGMVAVRTTITGNDLPDNLHNLRSKIEAAVPHGRSHNGGKNDKGAWSTIPDNVLSIWRDILNTDYEYLLLLHPKARAFNTLNQLGTLGGGNHFIEICLDERNYVWVMLHSGSRGVGNKIGSYFIAAAKREMERYHISPYLPDQNLSYLVEHTQIFDDYIDAVEWAQRFAKLNRDIMLAHVLDIMKSTFKDFDVSDTAINCHHNYISRENHFKANVIVTRKGAIRAREGDMGIIPGSMGAKSFIVRGKGNKDSFCSCSHGAGRKLGRKEAKRRYTAKDLAEQTQGIECPKDEGRVDEIPAAYKDIDQVMENQSDLVEIVHTLKQVVNIKG